MEAYTNREMKEKLVFIYDGYCPFCNKFAELLELKSNVPALQIKDARKKPNDLPNGYEMDVKGALEIKKLYPNDTFSIFIIPPSIGHLRERLIKRGTDSEKRIEIRLQRFQQEMEYKDRFDHVMINEDLDVAKTELIEIVNELKEGVLNGT